MRLNLFQMKTKNILSIFLLGSLFISCLTSGKPDNFDYGHIENGKYVNSFFKFEIALPDGWIVQSQEQMDNRTKRGADLITGDDKTKNALIKAASINLANLLSVYQYEVGAPVDFNSNISIVAENINQSPGIKTGSDYLFHARKYLKESPLGIEHIDENFNKEIIGGIEFYKMKYFMNINHIKINQIYYSTISNGFSLSFIITFSDEVQQQELLKSVNSLNFLNKSN